METKLTDSVMLNYKPAIEKAAKSSGLASSGTSIKGV